MVDRGDESNLVMTPGQIPAGITVGKVDKGSKSYMQGYVPMTANNKKFTFTSFHEGEQPHLISDSVFDPNRADIAPIEGSATVIPNAFRQSALASNGKLDSTATASAVANPHSQLQHDHPAVLHHNLRLKHVKLVGGRQEDQVNSL
jgi:hypothetical protein